MTNPERKPYLFPNPRLLFRRRLFSHWREQAAIIRTAADWTVLLYLIIPGLLLGGRLYYGLWQEALPAWSNGMPFVVIPVLFVFLISKSGLLLMLQEGDLMFLRQHRSWIQSIMRRGIIYSLAVTALKIAPAFVVVVPFMVRQYGLSGRDALAVLGLTLACAWCVKLLGHLVRVQRQGFRRWLWLFLAIAVPCGVYLRTALLWNSCPAVLWIAAALFVAAGLAAAAYRLRLQGTFMRDVQEDYKQRMIIAGVLLRGVIDKPRPVRHRPWIFRKSQPLLKSRLPESRLAAASIKALLRNPSHLKLYLSFTGVSGIAILLVPSLLKWLVFIVLAVLMVYWLYSYWSGFVGDDYIGILPFTTMQKAEAGLRAVPVMLSPFTVFCSALVCIPLYTWWGLVLCIPLGLLAGKLLASIFGTFWLAK